MDTHITIPMARLIELEAAEHERDILRADARRFRWLAERTVATGLARWVHPFQFLTEAVDKRMDEGATSTAPRVTTAAELKQQAKSDTSCVGAFARARPGKA